MKALLFAHSIDFTLFLFIVLVRLQNHLHCVIPSHIATPNDGFTLVKIKYQLSNDRQNQQKLTRKKINDLFSTRPGIANLVHSYNIALIYSHWIIFVGSFIRSFKLDFPKYKLHILHLVDSTLFPFLFSLSASTFYHHVGVNCSLVYTLIWDFPL